MEHRQASLRFILITVFLDVMGIGLMIPVLPHLIGTLTTSPDLQAHWFGALATTYGIMQFFCAPLLGALSDRFGRRPVLLMSIFGLGLSYIITSFTTSLILLLLTRVVSGATGASFSVANAYVADVTPPEKRGKGFGAVGAAFGIGFVFGPVIGGLLGDWNVRLPFMVAAGLSMINGLYGYFVLPESLPPERRTALNLKRANPFSALSYLSRLKGVGGLILVFALTVQAQFILQNTWVLYTEFRFGWTPRDNGMALFVVGLTSALTQGLLLGKLLKRFGEARVALIGLTSGAIIYVAYGLVTHSGFLYLLILCNFLSFAAGPSLQALISKAADPKEQGYTQGALNAINSIMIITAPVIGTTILATVNHLPHDDWRTGMTFFTCAAMQLLALTVAIIHFYRLRQSRLTMLV